MAFIDKMKDYFSKGVEVSKDAFSKAGDAVQDLGDKSVLMIEKCIWQAIFTLYLKKL